MKRTPLSTLGTTTTQRNALIFFPVFKGTTIGTVVIAVVNSGLGTFAQALIIAIISASIGAVGMVYAARIAREAARENRRQIENVHQAVDVVSKQVSDAGSAGDGG